MRLSDSELIGEPTALPATGPRRSEPAFQKIVLGTFTPAGSRTSSYVWDMDTTDHRDRRPIGLSLVILQMAVSAIAFVIVLGAMAVAMPLWQLGKRLISYGRHHRTMHNNSVVPVSAAELRADIRGDELRSAYPQLLRRLLTDEVQSSFKEQHERPTQRIYELIQQLEQRTPAFQPFAR